MKRWIPLAVLACVLGLAPAAQARTAVGYAGDCVAKLAFGVGDLVMTPFEIPINMTVHAVDFDARGRRTFWGMTVGAAVGGGETVQRAFRGAIDTATFFWAGDADRRWEWSIGGLPPTLPETPLPGTTDRRSWPKAGWR